MCAEILHTTILHWEKKNGRQIEEAFWIGIQYGKCFHPTNKS
jgi:hypothetical protein